MHLSVIPGGLTSLLQPLNVALNNLAVQGLSKKFVMPEEIHEFSASGRQKKDSEELIYLWVAEAWHDIPQDMILRSLLKCSISNSLDGTKNDLVQCI